MIAFYHSNIFVQRQKAKIYNTGRNVRSVTFVEITKNSIAKDHKKSIKISQKNYSSQPIHSLMFYSIRQSVSIQLESVMYSWIFFKVFQSVPYLGDTKSGYHHNKCFPFLERNCMNCLITACWTLFKLLLLCSYCGNLLLDQSELNTSCIVLIHTSHWLYSHSFCRGYIYIYTGNNLNFHS